MNTLIAATDGENAVLISGREIKAAIQLRNKRLAEIAPLQAGKTKRSLRHKRLQRRKYRTLNKAKNKVRDLCHKATRKVADAFPNAKAYVGEPFNDACRKMGRKLAQTISSACNRKIISLLNYKLAACIQVDEALLFADVPRMRRTVEAPPHLSMSVRIRGAPRYCGVLEYPHHRHRGCDATGL